MSKDENKGRGDEGQNKQQKKITLIFVIAGENVPVDVNVEEKLRAALHEALVKSQNTSRPTEEWNVYNLAGVQLDVTLKIESFCFSDGTQLMASVRTGAGG